MDTAETWTRRSIWLICVLVVGALASLPWMVHDVFVSELDGALYVRTSQSLLAGDGYSYLGEPFELRPPGFPVLLMPLLAMFGPRAGALNAYISLFGVACVGLYFVWLRRQLGDVPSFALAVGLWINPGFQKLCNSAMSDVPGTAFLFAALLVEEWARGSNRRGHQMLAGAVLAASVFVRSMSVLLLPAIVLSRALAKTSSRTPFRRSVWLLATCTVLLAPWAIRDHLNVPLAPADQTWLYSQWTGMWHTDTGDPNSPVISAQDFLERAPERFRWMASTIGHRMRESTPTVRHFWMGVAGAACLLVVAVRRRRAGEIFALGMAAVLLFWHTEVDRLVLPLTMFVVPALVQVLLPALARLTGATAAGGIAAAAVLIVAGLDSRDRPDWSRLTDRHRVYLEAAARLAPELTEDDVVAATIVQWRDALYLDRPVYGLRRALRRGGAEGGIAVLDRHGVNVVLLRRGTDPDFVAYLEENFALRELDHGLTLCRRSPPAPK